VQNSFLSVWIFHSVSASASGSCEGPPPPIRPSASPGQVEQVRAFRTVQAQRLAPMSGSPAWLGVILARREVRNSRTSARLSMPRTLRPLGPPWDALSVHLSTKHSPLVRVGM
jgi:hypothetical protein